MLVGVHHAPPGNVKRQPYAQHEAHPAGLAAMRVHVVDRGLVVCKATSSPCTAACMLSLYQLLLTGLAGCRPAQGAPLAAASLHPSQECHVRPIQHVPISLHVTACPKQQFCHVQWAAVCQSAVEEQAQALVPCQICMYNCKLHAACACVLPACGHPAVCTAQPPHRTWPCMLQATRATPKLPSSGCAA